MASRSRWTERRPPRSCLTIDRSNLSNNIWFPAGVHARRESYRARRAAGISRRDVYSAGEVNREFGEFNGGAFALGVLGYDLPNRSARGRRC